MKKLLRKSALIGVFYYLLLLINACSHCPPSKTLRYNVTGVSISNVVFDFENDSIYYTLPTLADSALLNEFGIRIIPVTKELAFNLPSIFLCNSVMAKCAGDYHISIDTIEKITVKTLKDFDGSHLAGADVTSYFNYFTTEIINSKSILKKIPVGESLINNSNDGWRSILLVKKPELDFEAQFELSLFLTNGTVFKDTTASIFLK